MATTTHRVSHDRVDRPGENGGAAFGDDRLVMVGGQGDDQPSAFVAAGFLFAPRRPSAVTVLDLERRTFVVSPGIAPDQEVIALVGELDLAGSPIFEGAVAAALRHRPARIVLDLRRLEFIDALGAGTIAATAARVREWDGSLTTRGALPSVERVLGLCGLGHLTGPAGTRVASPPPTAQRRVSPRRTASVVLA